MKKLSIIGFMVLHGCMQAMDYSVYRAHHIGVVPVAISLQAPDGYPLIRSVERLVGLPENFAYIGHYQNLETQQKGRTRGNLYNFRTVQAALEHERESLVQEAPASLATALNSAFGKDIRAIVADSTVNIDFYTVIWRGNQDSDQLPYGIDDRTNNVLFHGPAVGWTGQINFNLPFNMGLFAGNGVEMATPQIFPIPFNHFAPLAVIPHPADAPYYAASPNNARFRMRPDRRVFTFWLASYSPDKKHLSVSFNCILEGQPQIYLHENLAALLGRLEHQDLTQVAGEDVQAFRDAIEHIKRCVYPRPERVVNDVQRRIPQVQIEVEGGAAGLPVTQEEQDIEQAIRESIRNESARAALEQEQELAQERLRIEQERVEQEREDHELALAFAKSFIDS